MSEEVHIASLVVRHLPEAAAAIGAWVDRCPGLELAGQEIACSILLYEGSGTRELMDCIEVGERSPGVLSVNLIYHHAEPRAALDQPVSSQEQAGASDDLAS